MFQMLLFLLREIPDSLSSRFGRRIQWYPANTFSGAALQMFGLVCPSYIQVLELVKIHTQEFPGGNLGF